MIRPRSRPCGGTVDPLGQQLVDMGILQQPAPQFPQKVIRNQFVKDIAHTADEDALTLRWRMHRADAQFADLAKSLRMELHVVFGMAFQPMAGASSLVYWRDVRHSSGCTRASCRAWSTSLRYRSGKARRRSLA